MPKKKAEEIASSETGEMQGLSYAILFDLEGAAIQARRAEYEALCSILGETQRKLTPHLFARLTMDSGPDEYLQELINAIGNRKNVTDALVKEVHNGIAMFCTSSDAQLHPLLEGLLSEALKRQFSTVCLTGQKESTTTTLQSRWGAIAENLQTYYYDTSRKCFPRADTWLKAARSVSQTPRQCVAVVGSQAALRTALSAGMRTIVIPDEFTSFQDFSGADLIQEGPQDLTAEALLELVAPAKPSL